MGMNVLKELSKNGNTFTVDDALKVSGSTKEVIWVILSRMEEKGWIERIEKGKYMIIPLDSKKGEYTLHEFVIGSLLVEPYCIAYWSALHFYGFTEQIPRTVFIQTTSRKKNRMPEIFGIDYQVVQIKESRFFGIRREWIDETSVNITDREKTIVDCLDKPRYCGGVVEVAKALKTREFDKKELVKYAERIENTGVIRRLGYLCDLLEIDIVLPDLDTKNFLYLDPGMPKEGERSSKWGLVINLDDKVLGELE